MPKKKAVVVDQDEVKQVTYICPYCGEDQYTEWYVDCDKEDEECTICHKTCIVDTKEKTNA